MKFFKSRAAKAAQAAGPEIVELAAPRPGNWSWPAPTQLSCTSIHPALRWQRTAPLPIISCCAIPLS